MDIYPFDYLFKHSATECLVGGLTGEWASGGYWRHSSIRAANHDFIWTDNFIRRHGLYGAY